MMRNLSFYSKKHASPPSSIVAHEANCNTNVKNGLQSSSSTSFRGGNGHGRGVDRSSRSNNRNHRIATRIAQRAARVIPRTYSAIVRKTTTRQPLYEDDNNNSGTFGESTGRPRASSDGIPNNMSGTGVVQSRRRRSSPSNCNETIRKNTKQHRKMLDNYLQSIGRDWEMIMSGKDSDAGSLSSLRMDNHGNGLCSFAYKQFVIVVEMPRESTSFFIYTCLMHCTASSTAVMKRALELNYLTQQTNGCTIGMDSSLSTMTTTASPSTSPPNSSRQITNDHHEYRDDEEIFNVDQGDILKDFRHEVEGNGGDDILELTLSYTHPIVGLTQGEFCNILVNFMETAEELYNELECVPNPEEGEAGTMVNIRRHEGSKDLDGITMGSQDDKREREIEINKEDDCGSTVSSLGGGRPPLLRFPNPHPSSTNSANNSVRSISPPLSSMASFPPSPLSLEDTVLGRGNPFNIPPPPMEVEAHQSIPPPTPPPPPPPQSLSLCDTVKVSNKKSHSSIYQTDSSETVDKSNMAPVAVTAMSFEKLTTGKSSSFKSRKIHDESLDSYSFGGKIRDATFTKAGSSTTSESS